MIEGDKRKFAEAMVVLSEYYGRPVSDGVIELYWQGLKGYDIGAITQAFTRHMHNPESGQFMPKIADVVRMLQGSTQDTALKAWSKVDQAVRRIGNYADVVFDDPLIHRVLHDMGGWIGIGQKTEDEWPFVAREFENRYRGYRMRSEVPEYPPVLIGIAGAHNRKGGHETQPPMLVGNTDRCKAVMQGGTEKPLIGFRQASADLVTSVKRIADSAEDAA